MKIVDRRRLSSSFLPLFFGFALEGSRPTLKDRLEGLEQACPEAVFTFIPPFKLFLRVQPY